jgi:hypothetical protein
MKNVRAVLAISLGALFAGLTSGCGPSAASDVKSIAAIHKKAFKEQGFDAVTVEAVGYGDMKNVWQWQLVREGDPTNYRGVITIDENNIAHIGEIVNTDKDLVVYSITGITHPNAVPRIN